jgi:plastocyanin
VEVDANTGGLKDAVIWLEGAPARPLAADAPRVVTMDQLDFFFVPHVLAIRAGQEVEFTNGDPPNHAVQAKAAEPRNTFNVVTPPGGAVRRRLLPTGRPIAISCPLHEGMAAWIYVFSHAHFAVTDGTGRFRLPPVPPGRYRLVVDHAEAPLHRRAEIAVGPKMAPLAIALSPRDRPASEIETRIR